MLFLCFFLIFALGLIENVSSHGMMLNPPQRSSMWRFNYNVPVNYNDNSLNCNGYSQTTNQRCICGDPKSQTATPNNGGKYDTGIIAAHYTSGQNIDVQVKLTANHKGFFEFRLCPRNDAKIILAIECFDHYLLMLSGTLQTRYYPGSRRGDHYMKLTLPNGVSCSHCVLQWKYTAGNNYGCDATGKCCTGCGPQETFVNCADVAITGHQPPVTQAPTKRPTTQKPVFPPTHVSDVCTCTGLGRWRGLLDSWCNVVCTIGTCPTVVCSCSCEKKSVCFAVGAYFGSSSMNSWCRMNCARNFCPASFCKCQ